MATAPKAIIREAEVEDQAPAASLVSQVVSNLHVTASLPRVAVSYLSADVGPCVQPWGTEGRRPQRPDGQAGYYCGGGERKGREVPEPGIVT